MKYTAEDIKIHDPLSYHLMGLDINYSVKGGYITPLFLSNEALMLNLRGTNYCIGCSLVWNEVEIPIHLPDNANPQSTWEPLESFMQKNLNKNMASDLVLNYLNNKTEKP